MAERDGIKLKPLISDAKIDLKEYYDGLAKLAEISTVNIKLGVTNNSLDNVYKYIQDHFDKKAINIKLSTNKIDESKIESSNIINKPKEPFENKLKVFDLENIKQGQLYIKGTKDVLQKLKQELRDSGFTNIDFKGAKKFSGEIKNISIMAMDANNIMQELNFEIAKLKDKSGTTKGFIQIEPSKFLDTTGGTGLQRTLDLANKTMQDMAKIRLQIFKPENIHTSDEIKKKIKEIEDYAKSMESQGIAATSSQINKLKELRHELDLMKKGYKDVADTVISKKDGAQETSNFELTTKMLEDMAAKINGVQAELNNVKGSAGVDEVQKRIDKLNKSFSDFEWDRPSLGITELEKRYNSLSKQVDNASISVLAFKKKSESSSAYTSPIAPPPIITPLATSKSMDETLKKIKEINNELKKVSGADGYNKVSASVGGLYVALDRLRLDKSLTVEQQNTAFRELEKSIISTDAAVKKFVQGTKHIPPIIFPAEVKIDDKKVLDEAQKFIDNFKQLEGFTPTNVNYKDEYKDGELNKQLVTITAINDATGKRIKLEGNLNAEKEKGSKISMKDITPSDAAINKVVTTYINKLKILSNELDNMQIKWSAMRTSPELMKQLNEIKSNIDAVSKSGDSSNIKQEYDQLALGVKNLRQETQILGKDKMAFADIIFKTGQRLLAYTASVISIGTALNKIRQMIADIREIDRVQVALARVSPELDIGSAAMDRFTKSAFEAGRQIGRTGSQVMEAVTEFRRAGFELESSFQMGKAALMMTNISNGINSISEASGQLIAVMRGFNMDSTEIMNVLDSINEVNILASFHGNMIEKSGYIGELYVE